MRVLPAVLLLFFLPATSWAWGYKGHLLINRLAIDAAASRLPEFMNASREQIIYNGYEPDRWREEANTPMNTAQAPDHFFDAEYWGPISTIENDRYAFMEKVAAKNVELIRIGYLPYSIMETYGRLRNAFRMWRNAQTPEDREAARANAVYYAGILGHYVADGANPMHLTIHYNGWASNTPNPQGFTTDRTLHSRYESAYVNIAIDAGGVPGVTASERLANVFGAVKAYLTAGTEELIPLYEMEKRGEFDPDAPKPQGTRFIAAQFSRAAVLLSNLWYTAWLESAEPARFIR